MNKKIVGAALALAVAFSSIGFSQEIDKAKLERVQPHGDGSTPVLFIGDSMMRILGTQAEKNFKKAGIQPVAAFSSLGSGLVRPSVFNWTKKINELIDANKPKMVFIALGTNDRQALEAPDGRVINYTDEATWTTIYGELIGNVMDQFIKAGVDTIVWFLPPDMKAPDVQEHGKLLRKILSAEATKSDERIEKVQLFDMAKVLSPKPGTYSQHKISPTGQALQVRDPDGVHLTRDGAKIVAETLLKQYWK